MVSCGLLLVAGVGLSVGVLTWSSFDEANKVEIIWIVFCLGIESSFGAEKVPGWRGEENWIWVENKSQLTDQLQFRYFCISYFDGYW